MEKFLRKIDRASEDAWRDYWRLNYACAVQPRAHNHMPDLASICASLQREFMPERIRVVQLSPNQWGGTQNELTSSEIDALRGSDVEVIALDARRSGYPVEPGNIRVLADFFDFT